MDPLKRITAKEVLVHPWITGGARTTKLESAFTQLRRFNARRRFRAGVKKVMAAQAFARFGKMRFGGGAASTGIMQLARAAKEAGEAGAPAAGAGGDVSMAGSGL